MVNFKMTDNDYTEQSKYFEEGVHKVKIAGAIMDKMDDGREYVEIGVRAVRVRQLKSVCGYTARKRSSSLCVLYKASQFTTPRTIHKRIKSDSSS